MSRLSTHTNQIASFIRESNGKLVVLTGAGLSTGSGIPDYRGPEGIYRRNKDYKPIQYQQFAASHAFRQRYWARSFVGWQTIKNAKRNVSHEALLNLRDNGWIKAGLITQNVDGLLGKNKDHVLEIHGTLHDVSCMSCNHTISREEFQTNLFDLNPSFHEKLQSKEKITIGMRESNPDGDVEIAWNYDAFKYPPCVSCETGVYKPDVVFFGENMRSNVRDKSYQMVEDANHMLIVGSSLQVYSSFRLLKLAKQLGHKVAALNLGEFRGMEMVDLWVNESSDKILPEVARALQKEINNT